MKIVTSSEKARVKKMFVSTTHNSKGHLKFPLREESCLGRGRQILPHYKEQGMSVV